MFSQNLPNSAAFTAILKMKLPQCNAIGVRAPPKRYFEINNNWQRVKIHLSGFRFHVTFDVNKPWKFGHWVNHPLPVYKLQLRHFVVNNSVPLSWCVSMLKIYFSFVSCVWWFIKWVDISLSLSKCEESSRSVPARNNQTSSTCVK